MGIETIILVVALVGGLYMAWSIGANDVANAMGTSVGSGALTVKRAVILAAVLEFAGAFFVGTHVSETIRKGIINPALFQGNEMALVFGMIGALLAAAIWLQIASYFGMPVSTTHSIV
ncbi:MAG: inorganic phosphate transporter, partial [Calditrichaeota bacterium]